MLKKVLKEASKLVFPTLCLHCNNILNNEDYVLCQNCLEYMSPIDKELRCQRCFSDQYNLLTGVCQCCRKSAPPFIKSLAIYDHEGPAATLIETLQNQNQPFLAKYIAALMFYYFTLTNWPTPNIIIPAPIHPLRGLYKGYNAASLIANEMSTLMNTKYLSPLKWRYTASHNNNIIFKKDNNLIENQNILLIKETMDYDATLIKCAEAIILKKTSNIYVMSFCCDF